MRAVIVDDCAEDRLNLRTLLQFSEGVELAGEAADLKTARRLMEGPPVDLLFLDIEVGRENGFDLLRSLPQRPQVILTTVHRQYGEDAFDYEVTDYLVKPVTGDRLWRALQRAGQALGKRIPCLDRIAVHRSGSARRMVELESIVAVMGDDKYSRVIGAPAEYPDHRTLREWEALLYGQGFVRIDRSTLVCLKRIAAVTPFGRGAHLSFHGSSIKIEIGRAGRERLEEVIAAQAPAPLEPYDS
ncbi:MAG: LytR/AlgR family response regulator transcription factor [Chthoniobacteraceae bacterium]